MRVTFLYLLFWLVSTVLASSLISSDSVLLIEDDIIREEILAAFSVSGPVDVLLLAANYSNGSLAVELSQIQAHYTYPASSFKHMLEYDVKEKTYCACDNFAGLFGSTLSRAKCEEADYACKVKFYGLPGNIKGSDCLIDVDAGYCFGVCFKEKNRFPMYYLDHPVLQGFSFMYENKYVFIRPELFEEIGGKFNISFSSAAQSIFLPVSLSVVCDKPNTCWIIPEMFLNSPNECNPKKINPYLDACLLELYTVGVKSCKKDLFDIVPINWLSIANCPNKSLISPTNIKSGRVELKNACQQEINGTHCLVVANNTEYYLRVDNGSLSRADGQRIKAPAYILSNSSYWLSSEGILSEAIQEPVHSFHLSVAVTNALVTVRSSNFNGAVLSSKCAVTLVNCTEEVCTIFQDHCASRFCIFEKFGDNYEEDHVVIEFSPEGFAEIPRETGMNVGTVICGGIKSVLVYTESGLNIEDRNLTTKNETRSSSSDEDEEESKSAWKRFTSWLSDQKGALIGTIGGLGVIGVVTIMLKSLIWKFFSRIFHRPRKSGESKG